MADESRHEIQLNGKQLVFLFMASTVVAVVIFLCGIMVGRGVRAQRGELIAAAAATDPTAEVVPPPAIADASGASAASNESLSYPDRLAAEAPPETLKEPEPSVFADAPRAAASADPTRAPADAPDAGEGFTVQVAAVKGRSEADRMVKRLAGKGYPAYLTTPTAGAPGVFRVRVGKFKERREAESMAGRLEKEEQFKPWITR
jgi:cell division septation protein DedD